MVTLRNIDGEIIREFPELDTLAGADLSYEQLMFADFRGLDVSGTCFEGAELYGAEFDSDVLEGYTPNPPDFTNTFYEKVVSYGGGGHHEHLRGY